MCEEGCEGVPRAGELLPDERAGGDGFGEEGAGGGEERGCGRGGEAEEVDCGSEGRVYEDEAARSGMW